MIAQGKYGNKIGMIDEYTYKPKLAFKKRVKIEVSINIKVNFSFWNIAPEEAGKV